MRLSYLLLLFPMMGASTVPCVPKGGSKDVGPFTPDIGHDGEATSLQPDGDGSPKAYEDDWLKDDKLGDATPGPGKTATVKISCSSSGQLSGPKGKVENGGSEGDCIEVYVEWTYKYKEIVTVGGTIAFWPEGIGGSGTTTIAVERWHYLTVQSKETIEVCPCP